MLYIFFAKKFKCTSAVYICSIEMPWSFSTVKNESLVLKKRYSPFMADSRLPVNRLSLTPFALLGYNTSAVPAI